MLDTWKGDTVSYKLENLPRNHRGEYGIKARVPGVASKSFRARTINEARKAAIRWVEGVESGKERISAEITLAEYRAEMAPSMKWTSGTRVGYERLWSSYIEPYLGADPLSSIGRPEIRAWLSALERNGITAASRRQVLTNLMGLLNEAARDGQLRSAPNVRGLSPRVDQRKGIALTGPQMAMLLDALPDRYRTLVLILLTTGMRIGEALALRPEDVRQDLMTISVTKSVGVVSPKGSYLKKDRQPDRPKTSAGVRTVPLMPVTLAAIDDHIARFGLSPEGYLFTTLIRPHGWLSYPVFQWTWQRTVRQLREQDENFPPIRVHDLRKTFGAWMVANPNVTPMEAAKVLGHTDAAITLNIYAPLIPGRSAIPAAAAEMVKLLGLPETKELVPEIVDGEIVEG
jgi:integrase